MERRKCAVKECGAVVYAVCVDGQPLLINPLRVELVVPTTEAADLFQVVTGYQLHRDTCVDINGRRDHQPG